MGLQVRRRELSLISPQILKYVDSIGGSFQDCHGKEEYKEDSEVVATQVATPTILSVRPRSSPDGKFRPLFLASVLSEYP